MAWLSKNVALACDSEEVFSEVLFIAKSGMELNKWKDYMNEVLLRQVVSCLVKLWMNRQFRGWQVSIVQVQ